MAGTAPARRGNHPRGVHAKDILLMSSSDVDGTTLAEALQKYSDPNTWAKYMAIEEDCLQAGITFEHFGAPVPHLTGGDRKYRRLKRARNEAERLLVEPFVRRFRAGELVATGEVDPIISYPPARVQIPPERWIVLRPNLEDSSVAGGGVMYRNILVHETRLADSDSMHGDAGSVAPRSTIGAFPPMSKGGRPRKYDWDAFVREVVRRANTPDGLPDRSKLTNDMAQWCLNTWGDQPSDSILRDWVAKLYPDS